MKKPTLTQRMAALEEQMQRVTQIATAPNARMDSLEGGFAELTKRVRKFTGLIEVEQQDRINTQLAAQEAERDRIENAKRQGLNKLTAEERKALGL